MWDDTWDLMAARDTRDAASTFVNDMTEAGLGFARCYRCFTLVPLEFGNLVGKPLAGWVAEAGKKVTAQKCSAHAPVTVGAEAKPARSRPRAPGSAVFQPPGEEPVHAVQVPDVPGHDQKRAARS